LGLTPIRAFLRKHKRIALDTSVFIYQLEENPNYVEVTQEVFSWLEQPSHTAVTSTVTMTELLTQPYRQGNEATVNMYYGLLSQFPNLEWIAPNLSIADLAARLRAIHNLRTPDALQTATALRLGASALLTNDAGLSRVSEIEIGVLEQFQ